MPAVSVDTTSSQASVVDLLFAQQPEQRGERRHGVVARERDPLSPTDQDVDAADNVIAGELALAPDSQAFARQSRMDEGRSQYAEARGSFNDALQAASEARAKRSSANAAQQPQPAKPPTKPASDKSEQAESKADNSKAKTPSKSAASDSQSNNKPASQSADNQNQRSNSPAGTRVAVNQTAQAVQTPRVTPQQTAAAAKAVSAVTSVSSTTATSGSNTSSKGGSPAVAEARPATANSSASNAAKAKPAAAKPANDSAPFERLLRFVKLQANKDSASATLRLDPPELGRIRVEMDVKDDEVRLKINSQNEMAHRMLSENADTLRHALEASGVRVAELEIRPIPEAPSAPGFDADEAQTETRPQQESRGDSDGSPSGGDSGSTRHGGFDSSQAEVADAAARMRVWQETLIDVQA